jgi:hypothetical protein
MRCRSVALIALLTGTLGAGPALPATLDVTAEGDDLVFAWDAGTDDLLRGATPDDLRPWLTTVSSPLRVPGENALRGGNAYYRLASGSNMGFRIERTFYVDPSQGQCLFWTTLPMRRAIGASFELLNAWPTLTQVVWWDSASLIPRAAVRFGATVIGDDLPLPAHGGVFLAFAETTTLTLVGSHDDTWTGITSTDLGDGSRTGFGVLAVPYHVRWSTDLELLCGTQGVDWLDVDADGLPDECGRDLDGDGRPDTGLWRGADGITITRYDVAAGYCRGAVRGVWLDFIGLSFSGEGFALVPGHGYRANDYPDAMNLPFRPPTW